MRLNFLDKVFLVILIIGGVNLAILGVFGLDLISWIFGVLSLGTRTIFVIIGLAAIYSIFRFFRH